MKFKRNIVGTLLDRVHENVSFIQILIGPRQVGKTTALLQVCEELDYPHHYISAESNLDATTTWLESQWNAARVLAKENKKALLIIDEAQNIIGWQNKVKALWDEDRKNQTELAVVISGSSALLLKSGSEESLAGRFELSVLRQWSFNEMKKCFNFNLKQFLVFGGYPGAAKLVADEERWNNYIRNSLIDTAINKDILALNKINKPALLRQMFLAISEKPARILSYNKMLGQLTDAGNTTTLSHYKQLCEDAYLLKGLEKWSGSAERRRSSSPKWILLDNSLITAPSQIYKNEWENNKDYGFLLENAVGAHLCSLVPEIYYWREKHYEVDFIVPWKSKLLAIEVKSGTRNRNAYSLKKFSEHHPKATPIYIGANGIDIEDFLSWEELKF